MDKSRTLSFWKQSAKRPITFGFPSASIKEPRINSVYVHTINLEFDAFAKSTGATVSIIFQSIFQLWLALRSNQRDVTFDYLYTDRNVDLVDLQTINSIYTNFLPMRSTVNALIPVSEFLHPLPAVRASHRDRKAVSEVDRYGQVAGDHATAICASI